MVLWVTAALAYLVLAFIGSAVLVRFAPRHSAARLLRHRLSLFLLLPAFAATGLLAVPARLIHGLKRPVGRLFEALSGRPQYVRRRYSVFEYRAGQH